MVLADNHFTVVDAGNPFAPSSPFLAAIAAVANASSAVIADTHAGGLLLDNGMAAIYLERVDQAEVCRETGVIFGRGIFDVVVTIVVDMSVVHRLFLAHPTWRQVSRLFVGYSTLDGAETTAIKSVLSPNLVRLTW